MIRLSLRHDFRIMDTDSVPTDSTQAKQVFQKDQPIPVLVPSSFFLAVTGGLLSKLSQKVKARWKLFLSLIVSELFVVTRTRPASLSPGNAHT